MTNKFTLCFAGRELSLIELQDGPSPTPFALPESDQALYWTSSSKTKLVHHFLLQVGGTLYVLVVTWSSLAGLDVRRIRCLHEVTPSNYKQVPRWGSKYTEALRQNSSPSVD